MRPDLNPLPEGKEGKSISNGEHLTEVRSIQRLF